VVSAAAGAAPEGGVSAYMQGGPREDVYFTSDEIVAAVVTCGGLCPGLNTVVRELVSCLRQQYGVSEVFGVPHGYMGFYSHEWVDLTLERVETIHREGGSILGSSRGGHDTTKVRRMRPSARR
jgi:6-phosphofructokinase 1